MTDTARRSGVPILGALSPIGRAMRAVSEDRDTAASEDTEDSEK